MLIVEDEAPAAELTRRALEQAGLPCSCERVASEPEFRDALTREPDLILSDSNVPGFDGWTALSIARSERPDTPFIFVSGNVDDDVARNAVENGAAGVVSKSDLNPLPTLVRGALARCAEHSEKPQEERRRSDGAIDASSTASYLLERRALLDRALRDEDHSAMSSIMRRNPPIPVALVTLSHEATRDRFIKVLRNANIEVEVASDVPTALGSLEARTHALLFTDRPALVRAARQLHAGSATHIVFVDGNREIDAREALRTGANDWMSGEFTGEEFWSHLTTARRIVSLAASLQLAITDNRILSTIDELTRCGSRRFFEHEFPREVERAVRLRRGASLVMCDVDHFKAINDAYGHEVGDEVLTEFAGRLTDSLRLGQDWVARVGGEEFALVLPEVNEPEACSIAQRLCERIAATPCVTSVGPIRVTASFGVCGLESVRSEEGAWVRALVRAADAALYESKRGGRNRVTLARAAP
jgi:diguanylate cyclase (GGDEF)-like protein